MIYKLGVLIFIIINLSIFSSASAQYRYSIDIKEKKTRRVPLKFRITQAKQNFKINIERRKKRRISDRVSRKITKRTYKIQTSEVKRRMRKSRNRSEQHNNNKIPVSVKFKNILNG